MKGFDRIRGAYDAPGLDEHERAVLVLLAFMANEADDQARPSIAYIVEKTGKGERTVQRAIKRLVDAGHISRKQQHYGVIYTVRPLPKALRPAPQTGVPETGVCGTGVSEGVQTRTTGTQTEKRTTIPQKASPSSVACKRPPAPILDPDWTLPDEWRAWTITKFPQWPPGRIDREAEGFADHWRADPNRRRDRIDSWIAAWRTWCRNSERFENDRNSSPTSRTTGRRPGGTLDACKIAAAHRFGFEG